MNDVWTLVFTGMAIGIAIAAPVGAVGVLVIRRALADRPWAGFIAGLGGATGDMIYAAIAGFGLTAVTQLLETWQTPLRVGGGMVIIAMGIALLAHARLSRPSTTANLGAGGAALMGRRKSFFTALALTLGNPIVLLSLIAIFAAAGFGNDDPSFGDTCVLVGSIFAGSALWFLILSQSAHAVSQRYGGRAARIFDVLAAILLIVLGVIALVAPVG